MPEPKCDLFDIESSLLINGGKLDDIKRTVFAAAILQEAGRIAGHRNMTEEFVAQAITNFRYVLNQIPEE